MRLALLAVAALALAQGADDAVRTRVATWRELLELDLAARVLEEGPTAVGEGGPLAHDGEALHVVAGALFDAGVDPPTAPTAMKPSRAASGEGAEALVGTTLAGCDLHHVLGQGAMGAVYQAQQRSTGQVVAVKTILPELDADTEFLFDLDAVGAFEAVDRILVEVSGTVEDPQNQITVDLARSAHGTLRRRHLEIATPAGTSERGCKQHESDKP